MVTGSRSSPSRSTSAVLSVCSDKVERFSPQVRPDPPQRPCEPHSVSGAGRRSRISRPSRSPRPKSLASRNCALLHSRRGSRPTLFSAGKPACQLRGPVRQQPLRERLWAQLMLALYRSGRQAKALATYEQARRMLDEELGLAPGRTLQELERAILRRTRNSISPACDRRVRRSAPASDHAIASLWVLPPPRSSSSEPPRLGSSWPDERSRRRPSWWRTASSGSIRRR